MTRLRLTVSHVSLYQSAIASLGLDPQNRSPEQRLVTYTPLNAGYH